MDPTPSGWREARRFRAFELKQDGWKQIDIAEALGVSEGAVSQWMKKAREGGKKALKTSPRPGRPPKLSEEERTEELPPFWRKARSTSDFGVRSGRESAFGKSSRRSSRSNTTFRKLGGSSGRIGWSRQKPDHRSDKRDEKEIEEWKEEKWPRIRKSRD